MKKSEIEFLLEWAYQRGYSRGYNEVTEREVQEAIRRGRIAEARDRDAAAAQMNANNAGD